MHEDGGPGFPEEGTEPDDESPAPRDKDTVDAHATVSGLEVTDVDRALPGRRRQGPVVMDDVTTTPNDPGVAIDLPASIAPPSYEARYEVRRLLGEGGMGAVSLCRDKQIGRSVAMKVIRPEWIGDTRTTARFVREARIQGQLEHPAIVPVYDLGVDPSGAPYFSMKRVRGITLETIIEGLREGDPSFDEQYTQHRLLSAFAQVCLAIDFAHRRRVLHRDLKPANVMLGDYGEVYVLDWGLAKLMDEAWSADEELEQLPLSAEARTVPGAMLGTPGYMAPEQLRGATDLVGPKADIYALGAVLFEILTLTDLHPRGSVGALAGSTLQGVDARPSTRTPERDVAPELEAACVRATSLDPNDRHPTARHLHDAIEAYLEGERDLELRTTMAREHAARAIAAADRVAQGVTEIENRREAMREVGRALALDPGNEEVMGTLVRLLNEPPRELPVEVRAEMATSISETNRHTAKVGFTSYLSLFAYLPLMAWMGVRDAGFLWIFYLLALGCAGASLWTMRQRRPRTGAILVTMALSNVLFASTWPLFGPLVLMPTMVAANTASFAVHLERGHRMVAIACGCLAILIPVLLESTGLVGASYAFSGDGMLVRSQALDLSEGPALAFLCFVTLAAIVTGAMVVARVRNALRDAEKRLYLYAWHLREFVPEAVRSRTDPTVARAH